MRKALLFALLSLTAISACKKDKQTVNNGIVGNWELVLLTGGLMGIHQTATEWGHSQSYMFLPNGRCVHSFDGKSMSSIYSTREDATTYNPYKNQVLEIKGEDQMTYQFRRDTLILGRNIATDGLSEWYVRK